MAQGGLDKVIYNSGVCTIIGGPTYNIGKKERKERKGENKSFESMS